MRRVITFPLRACAAFLLVALAASADDDKLRDLGTNAAPGEIPKWDGSQWRNAHDDITTVVPGPGLTGGGTNTTVSVGVAFAGTGTSNTVARSDHNHPELDAAKPPVGAVVSWLKSFTNTPPQLPTGWAECNGQTLNDTNSVYHGLVIPNLNGAGGGAQRFLRGAPASGGSGGSDSHNHKYYMKASGGGGHGGFSNADADRYSFDSAGNPIYDYFAWNGPDLYTSVEPALPSYYEVVWIMRIK